jgi:hypothetical protein
MTKIIYLSMIIIYTGHFNLYSQTKYLIKDDEGFDYILNISLSDSGIQGYTREKALFDYASKIQYGAIKLLSPLKHPEIIRFKAKLNGDKFDGKYYSLFSEYKIVGGFNQDSINYTLYDKNDKVFKKLKGIKIYIQERKDYSNIIEKLIKTTEDNIYNPKIIKSKKWIRFKEKMKQNSSYISDDLELQVGFFASIRGFNFTHYYLIKKTQQQEDENENNFSLNQIDNEIALLKIKHFYGKSTIIDSILNTIIKKNYRNLIVDLRDNPGGDFETALPLANFLTNQELISGFFINKKWHEEYDRIPNQEDISKFNVFKEGTFDDFNNKSSSKYGVLIQTKGEENKFKGNVYFLVNENTGSTAEALIIGVKEYGLGKVIGRKTAGSLLNAKSYDIDNDIILLVPINDFISFGGYRVDMKGIKPDIKVRKQDILNYTINFIHNTN